MKVNHINIPSRLGCIYCHQLRRVVSLDDVVWDECPNCPMFNGSYQGAGVECLWDDPDAKTSTVRCTTPAAEQKRVGKY